MKAEKFLNDFARMCGAFCSNPRVMPKDCPAAKLCGYCKGAINQCLLNAILNPKEYIAVLEEWSRENPPISNLQRFREVFGRDPLKAGYLSGHTQALGLPEEWWNQSYENPGVE